MMAGIRQKGAALLMSLVILLVLTLLALSGMQGSVMQERMASAQREGLIALEVAEAGLRQAEAVLDALTDIDGFGSDDGFYLNTDDVPSPYAAATWTGTASIAGAEVNGRTPRYFFEYKGPVQLDAEGELPRDLGGGSGATPLVLESARVVVFASGPSGESRRVLESFYVFDLNN